MSIKERFDDAVKQVGNLKSRPSNSELLALYGLYKQATEGDNTSEPPGGFDFKALAKYNAWNENSGKDPERSMKEYISLAEELIEKYGA